MVLRYNGTNENLRQFQPIGEEPSTCIFQIQNPSLLQQFIEVYFSYLDRIGLLKIVFVYQLIPVFPCVFPWITMGVGVVMHGVYTRLCILHIDFFQLVLVPIMHEILATER
jgi:hypothetical protein